MHAMAKHKKSRQELLEQLSACDLSTLERLVAIAEDAQGNAGDGSKAYLNYIKPVAERDIEGLLKAEKSYGNSWKQRTGIGAFMMLARKWDRIEQRVAKGIGGLPSSPSATRYDIFEHIAADRRTEGIIDDIRDLRRYLMLVEAEMAARGIVKVGTSRDNIDSYVGGGDNYLSSISYYLTPEAVKEAITPPSRAYENDAGIDLRALYSYELAPQSITEVRTGIGFEIPNGYFGLICNRSSGGKKGLLPLGHVVDAGYTGELTLILHNINSAETIYIKANERIAQMVIMPVLTGEPRCTEMDKVKKTKRGKRGLGSSGSL